MIPVQPIHIHTNKALYICIIEKKASNAFIAYIYVNTMENQPTPIGQTYPSVDDAFQAIIQYIRTCGNIESICNDIAQELITEQVQRSVINGLSIDNILFKVEKI